jgi:DNA-binding transcriptional MocR family regulator
VSGADLAAARRAKDALLDRLGDHPLITGCGVRREAGGYAVTLDLVAAWDGPALPAEIDGVPVRVQVIGRVSRGPGPPGNPERLG